MLLTFFDKLREAIISIIENINFSSVLTLITGIIIGFVLCAVIYICLVLSAFKKEGDVQDTAVINVDNEVIMKLIQSSKNEYIEDSANLSTNSKLNLVKEISFRLINDIAKVYYPDSNYPIYELNIDELIVLCHYITDRINSIFKGPILSHMKRLKVSQVVKIIDFKKKIDENKLVKAANKAKVPKILSGLSKVINIINPVYWVQKLMIESTMSIATKRISLLIIDVIGEETTKVYSKSVFNKETDLGIDVDSSIKEIENLVEGEK